MNDLLQLLAVLATCLLIGALIAAVTEGRR